VKEQEQEAVAARIAGVMRAAAARMAKAVRTAKIVRISKEAIMLDVVGPRRRHERGRRLLYWESYRERLYTQPR
jgi:hypothetical protein